MNIIDLKPNSDNQQFKYEYIRCKLALVKRLDEGKKNGEDVDELLLKLIDCQFVSPGASQFLSDVKVKYNV